MLSPWWICITHSVTNTRTQTKQILQRKLYCQWQRGNIQKGFFFHNMLYSDLDLNSPTPVFKSTYIKQVTTLALTSDSPAGLKILVSPQHDGQKTVRTSYIFYHDHWIQACPCTCCISACSSLGNQCHGIFPIKQNNTFIKPQAWLLTRIRSQIQWHLIQLGKRITHRAC